MVLLSQNDTALKKELIDYAKESILGQKHLSVDELLSELSNQISENEN